MRLRRNTIHKHDNCEECGIRFSERTGREYVKDYGGQILDVCEKCAKEIKEELEENSKITGHSRFMYYRDKIEDSRTKREAKEWVAQANDDIYVTAQGVQALIDLYKHEFEPERWR